MRSKEQIKAEISATRDDLDAFIDDGKEFWSAARKKKSGLEQFKKSYRKLTKTVQKADETVTSNPYVSMAIAVGAGLLVGLLITRPRIK
ncbi:MAG: hypothetical protein JWN25_412 [Verrucomicrobiales bacterium]|nr:hypothetical protein [Verrucomicrobiales bacterium]